MSVRERFVTFLHPFTGAGDYLKMHLMKNCYKNNWFGQNMVTGKLSTILIYRWIENCFL